MEARGHGADRNRLQMISCKGLRNQHLSTMGRKSKDVSSMQDCSNREPSATSNEHVKS